MKNECKKILLVQLFSNGDCLYATAVARQIKSDFPGCELTWAIASFCKDIINLNPFVDHVRVVDDVPKSNVVAFRRFKKLVRKEKNEGMWDEVFITTNMDENLALYDGSIRDMILRAYPRKITVPVQPVIVLSEQEKQKVADFASSNQLSQFKNVILWEFAPQSGQADLGFDFVKSISDKLTSLHDVCVLLSSATSFESSRNVIDASGLSVRENAALTHYCTLLIGCSSGLTWLSTSSAARQLPMVQLLNENAIFANFTSVDFERIGMSQDGLIEIFNINEKDVYDCLSTVVSIGFTNAKQKFHQRPVIHFKTTRIIVYNLLCYLRFSAVLKHAKLNVRRFGFNLSFFKELFLSVLFFPFKLIRNFIKKKVVN